jgi:hypothetical protein
MKSKHLIASALLLTSLTVHANNALDDETASERFPRVADKMQLNFGFENKETLIAELTWQALNVIDTMQTVQIAKNPECFQEVGTLSLLYGNHPTVSQVYIGSAIFGVAHYLVAKGIDHLVQENPDYMVVQRVFQYGNLAYKTWDVNRNRNIGLGLTSSQHWSNCSMVAKTTGLLN